MRNELYIMRLNGKRWVAGGGLLGFVFTDALPRTGNKFRPGCRKGFAVDISLRRLIFCQRSTSTYLLRCKKTQPNIELNTILKPTLMNIL